MRDRKVIIILRIFSTKERSRLKRFIASPFFNTNPSVTALFEFLESFAPHYDHARLTPEATFAYVYPNQKFSQQAISRLLAKLLTLVERYIAHSNLEDDVRAQKVRILDFYNTRKLTKNFETTLKKARQLQAEYPRHNYRFYHYQYLMEREYTYFLHLTDQRTGTINLQNSNAALDIQYLHEKLVKLCEMANRQRAVKVSYDFPLLDELMNYLPNSPYLSIPSIEVWYNALLLLLHPKNYDYYKRLKQLLRIHSQCIELNELKALNVFLVNTCQRLFDGRTSFQETFDLYRLQLETRSLYEDGYIHPQDFRAIVIVGLGLSDFDWVERFLNNYRADIMPPYADDIYHFCLAQFYIAQQQYEKGRDILLQMVDIEYKDVYLKLGIRRLLAQIYFEQQETELLYAHLNAFRLFVHRLDTIKANHRKAHQQFINYIHRMLKITPRDIPKLKKLQQAIKDTPLLPERTWLIEKTQQLIDR